jgi:hypothetical protein
MRPQSVRWLASLVLLAISAAAPGAATPDRRERFMIACLAKQPKVHLCECMYGSMLTTLNSREFDLAIAFMAGDKARQNEIRSDPSFDYDAYNAKAGSNLMMSFECVLRRRK